MVVGRFGWFLALVTTVSRDPRGIVVLSKMEKLLLNFHINGIP